MTKPLSHPLLTHPSVKDWFLPAIEATGTVADCLDAVLYELKARTAFVESIKSCLSPQKKLSQDQLTLLGLRIKHLSQTLEFRLGMLLPDRPQAWYRPPAATHSGPFATTLLQEPVFCLENIWDVDRLRSDLIEAWLSRSVPSLPLLGEAPSLWRTLLLLNRDHEALCRLPEPHSHLRLDALPDGIGEVLESRPLRAFLLNVKQEVNHAREKLDDCYTRLLSACDGFWAAEKKRRVTRPHFASSSSEQGRDDPRDSYDDRARRRRAREIRSIFLAPQDYEALSFMGFDSLPSQTELRQRYLTMAKKLHPDRQAGKDEGFKLLSNAYERLLTRV